MQNKHHFRRHTKAPQLAIDQLNPEPQPAWPDVHTLRRLFILGLVVALIALAGCRTEADIQKDVDALVRKTLDNMVFVEGGSFMMGDFRDPESGLYHTWGADSKPAHKVTLDSYHIGKYEVTWGEFDLYTEANGIPRVLWEDWTYDEVWRTPPYAAGVNWQGARDYCLWLVKLTGLPFDLPTEAQWEYAARSRGQLVPFATDNGKMEPGRNYYPAQTATPYPPGSWPPNPLGLYDMSGNQNEWVLDWYDEHYYSHSPNKNPSGPQTGTKKIKRGGSFLESPEGANVFVRQETDDFERAYSSIGFRCAINSPRLKP
ncbi:SUMF1/EgtB/PvdO family nonheme iron enzyme [Hahella sp. SMD15-11]|uniref:SUMF1/EgtB/PvdO family nonheme iron enzyme n=1 Tax=Thermohahella caldifontis TaxID=3142973 RepID=A0AB39UUH4_9GAMM